MLALFCYRRSHLHALALSIAASCSERDLIEVADGSALPFTRSRAKRRQRVRRRLPPMATASDHALDQAAEHVLAGRDEFDEDFAQVATA